MTCDFAKDRLLEFLDRDATPEGEAEIQAHTASCGDCRSLFDTARRTADVLAGADRLTPSREMTAGSRRRRVPLWLGLAAAAAALLVALGAWIQREESPPRHLRIEIVDATGRVEKGGAEALLESHLASSPIYPGAPQVLFEDRRGERER